MPLPQFLENSIQANGGGANLLFGIIFAKKLHENEKKLNWEEERASLAPSRSTTVKLCNIFLFQRSQGATFTSWVQLKT